MALKSGGQAKVEYWTLGLSFLPVVQWGGWQKCRSNYMLCYLGSWVIMFLNILMQMCFQASARTRNHNSRNPLSRFRFPRENYASHNKLPSFLIYCLLTIPDAWERKTDGWDSHSRRVAPLDTLMVAVLCHIHLVCVDWIEIHKVLVALLATKARVCQ